MNKSRATVKREVVVVVKCIGCGATKEVHAGEVPANEVPMCSACGNPMIATKARQS